MTKANTEFVDVLRRTVRGQIFTDATTRGIYATDASLYQEFPQAVVIPVDDADVIETVKVANQYRVPITARGAATALSGQTFGPGIVIDTTNHLNDVLEIDKDNLWARVQPGISRDNLNSILQPLGLYFAPDPATSSRATIGGMVGNNSSGMRSIVHGKTIDHVLGCRILLSDGSIIHCRPYDSETWNLRARGIGVDSDREAEIYSGVQRIVERYHDEILERYPNLMRRVSGYNLDEFVDGAGYTGPIGRRASVIAPDSRRVWNLTNLIVGSEGTLALVLDVTIRLTPLPTATAVCVAHFDNTKDALAAVPIINANNPSAVEIIDAPTLSEAKDNASTRKMAWWIDGEPASSLLIEFSGTNPAEVSTQVDALAEEMDKAGLGYSHRRICKPIEQRDVWELRKLGLGLISNSKGPMKGQTFVEDACVPVQSLADYIERLQHHCNELGVHSSLYGHASVGVIHFRPVLDPHLEHHRKLMRQIADYAFELVTEYGGVMTAEHGDGIVRGEYVRRFFGPVLYDAFQEIKQLFDPQMLMNPGKITACPDMMDSKLLRYGEHYQAKAIPSVYKYQEQGGFRLAVEQCNGVGACRKMHTGTMCPSFMATRNEKDSTRARANTLRLAMSGQLGDNSNVRHALGSDEVHDVLELCLSCKACKSECPNAVDISRLKGDALQMRHDRMGVPLGDRLLGSLPDFARYQRGTIANITNKLIRLKPFRNMLEALTGIDRRRPLPTFAVKHFNQYFKNNSNHEFNKQTVVLFNDTYTNTMEPHIGLAAIRLLEGCGYNVISANAGCCQRPRLSKGLLRAAKKYGERTIRKLDVYAKQGLPILCLEPSCASALKDDLPDLIGDHIIANRVAKQVFMIDEYMLLNGAQVKSRYQDLLLHGHCHQKALFSTDAIRAFFEAMPDTTCTEVDSGCCGMAGSFGYEHFDLSKKIGEDRLFPAVRKAIQDNKTIVACGVSCRHQLHDCLGVTAKHWVEVVEAGT